MACRFLRLLVVPLKAIHDKYHKTIYSRLYPSHSGQKDKDENKLRVNWRQCNTSDTVGPSIASKRQGPRANKNKINRKNRFRRTVSEIKLKRTDTTLDLSLIDS